MAKELIRSFRDSSEGCVYDVYYDTNTGRYSQCRRGREDEKYIDGLIRGLTAKRDIYKRTTFSSDNLDITNTINWLGSLKDKVQFEQGCYNDEDLDTIADRFIPEPTWNALEESKGEGSCAAAYDYSQMIAMFKAGVQWLKSLRPQNRWKPSKEMLEALYRAVPQNVKEISEDEILLGKLYQGLKYGRVISNN